MVDGRPSTIDFGNAVIVWGDMYSCERPVASNEYDPNNGPGMRVKIGLEIVKEGGNDPIRRGKQASGFNG